MGEPLSNRENAARAERAEYLAGCAFTHGGQVAAAREFLYDYAAALRSTDSTAARATAGNRHGDMTPTTECACGHLFADHGATGDGCDVEGCGCINFRAWWADVASTAERPARAAKAEALTALLNFLNQYSTDDGQHFSAVRPAALAACRAELAALTAGPPGTSGEHEADASAKRAWGIVTALRKDNDRMRQTLNWMSNTVRRALEVEP